MNFMFSWQEQYPTRSLRSLVRYCSCHSNIKFISSRHRVISSMFSRFIRNQTYRIFSFLHISLTVHRNQFPIGISSSMTGLARTKFMLYRRVHCSLGLHAKRTSDLSNRTCGFSRPTCLTLSLKKDFWSNFYTWYSLNQCIHELIQGVHRRKRLNKAQHRHRPFQKLAQIFFGFAIIFQASRVFSLSRLSELNPGVHNHGTCMLRFSLFLFTLKCHWAYQKVHVNSVCEKVIYCS